MSKPCLAVLFGVTFLIGACFGGGASIWLYNEFLVEPNAISSARHGVSSKVAVLEAIRRSDDEKATSLLETYLDGDLIVLSVLPDNQLDQQTVGAILRAADYRNRYPHISSEPKVTSQVSELLSKHSNNRTTRQ